MFHKHSWVKIKETFAPPSVSSLERLRCEGYSPREISVLTSGFTTILWECSTCHKIRREEMLGK